MNEVQWVISTFDWLWMERSNILMGAGVFLFLGIIGILGGGMSEESEPWTQQGMEQAQWEYYQQNGGPKG
jgi:hypothetical protein